MALCTKNHKNRNNGAQVIGKGKGYIETEHPSTSTSTLASLARAITDRKKQNKKEGGKTDIVSVDHLWSSSIL